MSALRLYSYIKHWVAVGSSSGRKLRGGTARPFLNVRCASSKNGMDWTSEGDLSIVAKRHEKTGRPSQCALRLQLMIEIVSPYLILEMVAT
jgi:hypothetical protein